MILSASTFLVSEDMKEAVMYGRKVVERPSYNPILAPAQLCEAVSPIWTSLRALVVSQRLLSK